MLAEANRILENAERHFPHVTVSSPQDWLLSLLHRRGYELINTLWVRGVRADVQIAVKNARARFEQRVPEGAE